MILHRSPERIVTLQHPRCVLHNAVIDMKHIQILIVSEPSIYGQVCFKGEVGKRGRPGNNGEQGPQVRVL